MAVSLADSPWEICILSAVRSWAWPPSWVMPASMELRVRVDCSKKIMNRVLSGSSRCGSPSAKRFFRSKEVSNTVSRSFLLQSSSVMK